MNRLIYILLIIGIGFLHQCKEEKKDNSLLFGALAVAGSGGGAPPSVTDTYKDGASFTLSVGGSVTLNPPNHVEGSTYTVSPSLPAGLILGPNTGVISGTPTGAVGGTTYTVTQTKPDGTKVSYAFSITVSGTGGGGSGGTLETVATPTFNPASGTHSNTPINLAISSTTSGASIYFTTDGTDPTSSATLYNNAVHIWSVAGKTVKAIATKAGMTDSAVATLSGVFSYPPLKTGSGAIIGYTLVANEDDRTQGVNRGYTDNGNGTVTDNATGLVWQKCSRGQNNDGTCSGTATTASWDTAGTYCSGLSLASRTWRLPSRQELETLPDYSKSSPAIDTTAFPGTVANNYWSSTTYAPNTSNAWLVDFFVGNVNSFNDKTNNLYVRCVSRP